MADPFHPLHDIARLRDARTRSICAENPTGAVGGGALAAPGDDAHCTDAARTLGKGWKVRPCLRDIAPGARVTLADITGPGVVFTAVTANASGLGAGSPPSGRET